MKSRTSWLLLILAVLLGSYAIHLQFPQTKHMDPPPKHVQRVAMHSAQAPPAWDSPPFTSTQFDAFLLASLQAETISDPLQRCIAYPNPPGLHWSDTVTSAYCHFRYDSWISRREAFRLIRSGQANKVDEQLTAALHAQLTSPGMPAALDHTLFHDFADSNSSTREVIDIWKKQRPESAFAWAASGMAYLMTADAIQRTSPDDTREAVHHYLVKALSDLKRAVQLNPRITHAYASMIDVGRMEGDPTFAIRAARLGLAVDPSNFTLYNKLILASEPKAGGSAKMVKSVVREAWKHADANPLLRLLTAYSFASNECLAKCEHCGPDFDNWVYDTVFAHAAPFDMFMNAACGAQNRGHLFFAAIYHSEAFRFYSRDSSQLESRALNLLNLGRLKWALESANNAVRQAPNDYAAYDVRGDVYRAMNNDSLALANYRHALRIYADDRWASHRIDSMASKATTQP